MNTRYRQVTARMYEIEVIDLLCSVKLRFS
jgi:hypothetical protein